MPPRFLAWRPRGARVLAPVRAMWCTVPLSGQLASTLMGYKRHCALIHQVGQLGRTAGRGVRYYAVHMPGQPLGRIRLGDRLRALRERAGVTRLEAARAIKKRNEDSVRHFETGHRLIGELELDVLARFYKCSPGVIAELEELYTYARRPGEFANFGLPENIVTYLELERAANVIRTFHNLVIPGLLQAEPYVRRLLQLGNFEANVIDQWVRARLKRQERLAPSTATPNPAQLIAVIAEEALLRCAREPDVGAAQLARLIEVGGQENVEIRIMDLDAKMHPGMAGSFTCLAFPEDMVGDFAYQETTSGGQLTELAATVTHLDMVFGKLRSQALGAKESLALIARLQGS